jgi:hypothetical protein
MNHTAKYHTNAKKVSYNQESIIQYSKVSYNQESIIQCRMVPSNAGKYHTMQDGTIQCRKVPYQQNIIPVTLI